MVPTPSRRAALRFAGVAVTSGLAGCGAIRGLTDPDAGTDSYGILARNRLDERHDIRLLAKSYDSETILDETVTLEPGEEREYDELLTEDGQYVVRGTLPHEHFDGRFNQDRITVQVGRENGRAVPNVTVEIYSESLEGIDHFIHAVRVSL